MSFDPFHHPISTLIYRIKYFLSTVSFSYESSRNPNEFIQYSTRWPRGQVRVSNPLNHVKSLWRFDQSHQRNSSNKTHELMSFTRSLLTNTLEVGQYLRNFCCVLSISPYLISMKHHTGLENSCLKYSWYFEFWTPWWYYRSFGRSLLLCWLFEIYVIV